MCYRLRYSQILFLCLLIPPAAAIRRRIRGNRRLALVRFENLTSDPGLDWLSRAIPGTLAMQLDGSPEYIAFAAETDRDVRAGQANLELVGYYTLVNGRLQITSHLRVPSAGATVRTLEATGDAAKGPMQLIDTLARQISPKVQPLPTRSVEAARAFWSAGDASSPQEAAARLEAAAHADPSFGAAYLSGIEAAIQRGDKAEAGRLLTAAIAASSSFDEGNRARLRLLESNLKGDAGGRAQALTELARVSPADAGVWRELGTAELGRRNYAAAVEAFEHARKIAPNDSVSLNLLGYAKAFSGDFNGSRAALEEYSRRLPKDANAFDSLGDVGFFFGRFDQAAKDYQQAHQTSPALLGGGDLYRAAVARYFAGNLQEADTLFASYLQFLAGSGDRIGPVREAVWEASTGRFDRAVLRLQNFMERKDAAPEARSVAASQQALFALAAGKPVLFQALPASSPAGRNLQFYAGFLSQPDSGPDAWTTRADALLKAGQPAQAVRLLLGYALLLHGHFAAAIPVWQVVLAQVRPELDSDARVMLAWANADTGHAAEAAKLLERYPIPAHGADPGLSFLTLAKCRELRK